MRKVLLLLMFCMVLSVGSAAARATGFNYDEAVAIGYGTWVDTETGQHVYPIWKNKAGETNIISNKGYTDSLGESRIFFDYKGVQGCLIVTYDAKADKYFAEMNYKPDIKWITKYARLVRVSTEQ
ncbi:hypothetical protein [Sporomusa aerivorans]|uniref:hypothetical protein n=1 Tax=Sporomusa aerivorans TaxID=204936 RepID=UPI003529FA18